jgi:Protein of unknown function (DUF3489)
MPKQRKPARSNSRKRLPAARAPKTAAKHTPPKQEPALATTSPRPSKKASILGLLQRPQGAAIEELTAATGWQSHSVRATLTGFRKEGRELVRSKDDTGTTRYSLAEA